MEKEIDGIIPVPNYDADALTSASSVVVVDQTIEIGRRGFVVDAWRKLIGVTVPNLSSSAQCDMCEAQLYIVPRGDGGVMGNLFYRKTTGQEGFLGSLPGPTEAKVLSQASVLGFVERR